MYVHGIQITMYASGFEELMYVTGIEVAINSGNILPLTALDPKSFAHILGTFKIKNFKVDFVSKGLR